MQRAGWWRGSDGQWYPPEAARHPAARGEPAAPRRHPPRRLVLAGPLWLIALLPVVVLLVVLSVGLADPTPTDRVETLGTERRGPGDETGAPAAGAVSASVSASVHSEAIEAVEEAIPPAPASPPESAVPAAPDAGPGPDDDGEEPPDGSDDDRDRPDQGPDDSAPGAAPSPTTSAAPPPAPPPAPPSPATPADADDCKRGGWQHLVDDAGRPFANQGECVSYASRR